MQVREKLPSLRILYCNPDPSLLNDMTDVAKTLQLIISKTFSKFQNLRNEVRMLTFTATGWDGCGPRLDLDGCGDRRRWGRRRVITFPWG